MISTGGNDDGRQRTSEMIDLAIKSDSSCKNWAEFPKDVDSATGGVIKETVVICGGGIPGESFDECYSLNGKVATLITHMSAKRAYAASLVINGASLWITGGLNSDTGSYLASSEYITLEGSIPGPDIPIHIIVHALVAINKTCSMIIGGRTWASGSSGSPTVYYFVHEGNNWSQGQDLMQARESHAAGIVTDETTYEEIVTVTGGENNGIYLDSTETLIDNQWHLGKIATLTCVIIVQQFLLIFQEKTPPYTFIRSFVTVIFDS